MGDNKRRRGSVRDILDEDLPRYSDRGRYREDSTLPQNSLPRPRHHSRLSSWEEKGDTIVKDKVGMAETRERSHNSGYYRSMSPEFNGLEQQKWSNGRDKQWRQFHRYEDRRRSRSRSRGLEKSRSRSPGWGRGRNHARGRSRSRSRSKGSIRGRSRSRSPCYDQGSEPPRHCDRRSGPGRSSQTCKDFVVGMCRRGSQCRFLHSDNVLRDDESLDSDISGRWKGKQELAHGSKYHYDTNTFSDAYNGENDPLRNRPRGAIICRDFVKGNCRYGESCRFSHSAESGNVDKSYRNVHIDRDRGFNSSKAGSNLCKFFLAGNCRRDNCRFSHDTPLSSDLEDRIHDKSGGGNVGTLEEYKGQLWDEHEKPANTRKISKWGASVQADMKLSEDVSVDRRGDETVGKLEEWKGPLWGEHEKPANTRKISKWGASIEADNMELSGDVSVDRRSDERWGSRRGDETVGKLADSKGPLWDEHEKPANTRKISKWGSSVEADVELSGDVSVDQRGDERRGSRRGDKTVGKLEEWKGPLWDEHEKPVKTRKLSKWGPSVEAEMELSGDVSVNQRGDERWRSSLLEDEKRSWEHDDQFLNRDNYDSNNRTNDESSSRMYAAQTIVIENALGKSEEKLASEEFRSQSSHGLAHISDHNHGGEAAQHYLSSPSAHTQVFMTSDTHQYQGMAEHNRGPVLESGSLCEVKDYSNINRQSFNAEINLSCDNSSLLNMNGQQMLQPLSNAPKVDLNESGHLVVPSNLNEQINSKQSTIEHMPEPSALSSFSVQASNDQYAPHNTLPVPVSNVQNIPAVHVAESFLGECKTQLHTALEPSTMMEIAPSQSLLHPLPADCPQNVSNSTRSLDQYPVPKSETVYGANDQKARELLSSLSMIDSQLSTLNQIGDSKVEGNNVSKENLHEATKELEVNDNVEKCNPSSKMEADNYCSNRADDQGKEEGGNNNKDEKAIRFKIALVEFVKDILKPKWKEGKMSREVHKNVVKKVVDKVTVTIQAEHVPKTQEQVELYLSSNRPKISKLVQAYVERSLKAGP